MHSKYYWCLLLLCSLIFITLADEQPERQLVKRQLELTGEDVPEALLDEEENSILEDDEEDEEATSSLNHIDEDDAKEVVEEITEWANADHGDEDGEEVEEDLVDDEDYEDDEEDEDDEHDHEHGEDEEEEDDEDDLEEDEDDEDDEVDDEEVAEEEEEREAEDETLDQEEKNALGEVNDEFPPSIEPEAGNSVDWNQQPGVVPQNDHAAPGPFDDGKAPMSSEQDHANAEYETKEQEGNLMDTEADDAGQDIPMGHDWNGDHEQKPDHPKQINDDLDWKEEEHIEKQQQRSASGHHSLLWFVAIAFVLVFLYRANSKSSQAKNSILPLHQNDIKPQPLMTSPVQDPTVDAKSNRLHPSAARGHHRKTSSISAHLSPRPTSRPASGNDLWSGDWKEGKEW
ncbi:hypothetical protein NQZ79_g5454 [Umbelopsis isabellina]|nr:hypothetical protein NQZ79_g5454 [Umbelopsis isabellina]